MCIAKNCIDEIIMICERIKENQELLTEELQKNDLATQDILHFIELDEINPVLSNGIVQKIKSLRKIRRHIKDELEPLQIVNSMLETELILKIRDRVNKKENGQKNRTYTPRIIKGNINNVINL